RPGSAQRFSAHSPLERTPGEKLTVLVGIRYKKLRVRESCSVSLNAAFGQLLVPNLTRDVVLLVHFAIRALSGDSVGTLPLGQGPHAGRHHPRFEKRLGIFDRHVVADLVSDTRESLDDVHAGRV